MFLRLARLTVVACLLLPGRFAAAAADAKQRPALPVVRGVEPQPLKAQARRVAQALDLLGNPLDSEARAALDKALDEPDADSAAEQIQQVFDPLSLAAVEINAGPSG